MLKLIRLLVLAAVLIAISPEGILGVSWGNCNCQCVKPQCDWPKTDEECKAYARALGRSDSDTSFHEGHCWVKASESPTTPKPNPDQDDDYDNGCNNCCKPRPTPKPEWKTNFTASPVFTDVKGRRKQYLVPIMKDKSKGDWFTNRHHCKNYNLQMVSIWSEEENDFVHNWLRGPTVNMKNPGVWLGAQIYFINQVFKWNDCEEQRYANFLAGEPNEGGITCLHLGWDDNPNVKWWWNYYCTLATMTLACQVYV